MPDHLILCLAGTIILGGIKGVFIIQDHAARHRAEDRPPVVRDWRPDIRHCLQTEIDTWDCIRQK